MTPESGAREGSASDGSTLDAFGRLQAALASALPGGLSGGVGCHYWTRPVLGVPVDQLEALGLVKAINTRIPVCEAHGCAVIAACKDRETFAGGLPGRSRRKFRLTTLGSEAAVDPSVLVGQITEQPLARRILDVLDGATRPTGWLELYWQMLEPELTELEETGQRQGAPLSRPTVRFHLDLLVAAGSIVEEPGLGLLEAVPR